MNLDPHLSLDAHHHHHHTSSLPGVGVGVGVDDGHDSHDAEAALEALRMAIGHQGSYGDPDAADGTSAPTLADQGHDAGMEDPDAYTLDDADVDVDGEGQGGQGDHTLSAGQWDGLHRTAAALEVMGTTVEALAAGLEVQLQQTGWGAGANIAPGLMQPAGALKKLVQTSKGIRETAKGLVDSLTSGQIPTHPSLYGETVPRSDYDGLKYRLDALLAQGEGKKGKRRQPKKEAHAMNVGNGGVNGEDGLSIDPSLSALHGLDADGKSREDSLLDTVADSNRRKRSMRLEHLIHQRANRLLGVEYNVSSFEMKGSTTLPAPSATPPGPTESIHGIQEHRPEWTPDQQGRGVRQYLSQVVEEVMAEWPRIATKEDDREVDVDSVVDKVGVYWVRLCKRWDEQQSRARGEMHRDEVTRRKQNQFRRQQSLLARRQYAFDTSPLNLCKLRALYRSLLTIDYAPPTNDLPDPSRQYTEDEWGAYQKMVTGPRAHEAHEVVDLPWLSETARSLLTILDVYSADLSSRQKRKGKPKTPAPTFHLPRDLWVSVASSLPLLRPKDAEGLPIPDQPGLIIFRFAVSDEVQRNYPQWSAGLYDNPPVGVDDAGLAGLGEVLGSPAYSYLKGRIQREKEKANPARLDERGVREWLAKEWNLADPEPSAASGSAAAHGQGRGQGQDHGLELDPASVQATQDLLAATAASGQDLLGGTNPYFLSAQLGLGSGSTAGAGGAGSGGGASAMGAVGAGNGAGGMSQQQLESLFASTTSGGANGTAGAVGTNGDPLAALGSASTSAALAALGSLGSLGALGSGGLGAGRQVGPSPGSSLRARKVAKRQSGHNQPEGAAVPVPMKRRRMERIAGGGAGGDGDGAEGAGEGEQAAQGALDADMGVLADL